MELKAKLEHPYTSEQKTTFIITQNQQNGYEIRFVEREITDEETQEVIAIVIDLESWSYTDEELLVNAKTNKQEENTLKAQEAIANGYVVFKDAQFETNTQTCSDLTSTMLLMQAGGLESYDWLSKDDKDVTLTLNDFGSLGALIADYKNVVWNTKYLDFKSQIESAETIEEVEEIEINYDVPELVKEIE